MYLYLLVASSNTKSDESFNMARARHRSCCCPTDHWLGVNVASKPPRASTASQRLSRKRASLTSSSSSGVPRESLSKSRLSRTLMPGMSSGSCVMVLMRALTMRWGTPARSTPSMVIRPSLRSSVWKRASIRELLPLKVAVNGQRLIWSGHVEDGSTFRCARRSQHVHLLRSIT